MNWNPPHNYHPNRKKLGLENEGYYLITTIRENNPRLNDILSYLTTICNKFKLEIRTGPAYGQQNRDRMPGFINIYCTEMSDMSPFWREIYNDEINLTGP